MCVWLVDKQQWFLVTQKEMQNIVNSGLRPEEFTRENIQQFLLY